MQTVTLSLFRFDSTSARLWVLGQMGAARFALPKVPGLEFWKLCGSGTGEGFTPRPNWGVWAILGAWENFKVADEGIEKKPFSNWRSHADETYTIFMEPASARGHWAGRRPFQPEGEVTGPIAAMTRATVKPGRAQRF